MADIVYRFTAAGYGDVLRAFRSIDQAAAEADRNAKNQARSASRAARSRTTELGTVARTEVQQTRLARQMETQAAKRQAANDRRWRSERRELDRARAGAIATEQAVERERTKFRERRVREETRANAQLARERRGRLRAVGGVVRDLGVAAVAGGMGLAAGGGAIVGRAVAQGMRLQELATDVAIQARGAGQKSSAPAQLRREWEASALAVPGARAEEIGAGVGAFVTKTGRLDIVRQFQTDMATIMMATGATGHALGTTMADMFEKFDVSTVEQMRDAMAALTFQGKKGAFEFGDMSNYLAEMASAASRFGMRGSEGVKTLGGLAQIARQATPSGAEAATAVQRMFSGLLADAAKIKTETGYDIYQRGKGGVRRGTRDIREVLPEVIARYKGEGKKMQGLFGEYGIRAVSPLIKVFDDVRAGGASVADAMAQMRAVLDNAVVAGGSWADMQEDAATRQQTVSAQVEGAWQSVVASISRDVMPQVASTLMHFATAMRETNLGSVLKGLATVGAEAAMGLTDFARALGIGGGGPQTPEERIEAAGKELAKIEEKRAGAGGGGRGGAKGVTQADIDREAALRRTIAGVEAEMAPSAVTPTLTREQFEKRLAATGLSPEMAARAAGRIEAAPNEARGAYVEQGVLGRLFGGVHEATVGATPERRQLVEQYAESVTAERGRVGLGGGELDDVTQRAVRAFAAFTAAMDAAAVRLVAIKRVSAFDTPP